jgi:hypothetical protein
MFPQPQGFTLSKGTISRSVAEDSHLSRLVFYPTYNPVVKCISIGDIAFRIKESLHFFRIGYPNLVARPTQVCFVSPILQYLIVLSIGFSLENLFCDAKCYSLKTYDDLGGAARPQVLWCQVLTSQPSAFSISSDGTTKVLGVAVA